MILLVGHYREFVESRRGEYAECVRRNAANPCLDEIHVFIEDTSDPAEVLAEVAVEHRAKLRFVELRRRLLFVDLFRYASDQLAGVAVAIANADIFFDDTLGLLAGRDLFNQLLCLSRWDEREDGSPIFYDQPWRQDAWIFEAPLRPFDAAFHLGLPGCDNRIAAEAAAVGIAVSNPSRSIIAHHLHCSGTRNYNESKRIGGLVCGVPAEPLPPADE